MAKLLSTGISISVYGNSIEMYRGYDDDDDGDEKDDE